MPKPEYLRGKRGRAAVRSPPDFPDLTLAGAAQRLSEHENAASMSSVSFHTDDERPFARKIAHRGNLKRWGWHGLSLVLGLLIFRSGEAGQHPVPGSLTVAAADAVAASLKPEELRMWMTIGEHRFAITLADNAAARTFAGCCP